MQSTQNQPDNPPADQPANLASQPCTPAKVLRHAAVYLWRYGWTTHGFYHRDDEQVAFPPACVAGGFRCAVLGRPVEIPDHDIPLLDLAHAALADEVDPDWTTGLSSALDVVSDWNDEPGRTITQVLFALYAAADTWDAAHPATTTAVPR